MMMVNPAAPMVRARKLAELGSVLLLLAIVAIVVSALRQHVGDPALHAMREGASWLGVFNAAMINAIWVLPSAFLILALLELREALGECFMTAEAGASLSRAGYWALWALFAKMIIAPTAYAAFGAAPFDLVIAYESFDFGMLGFLALVMLAGGVIETANSRTGAFA